MSEEITFMGELDRLEEAMQGHPVADCPVTHHFAPGLYIRECFVPAGTLLTSAIHKTAHPFVLAMGSIAVISETEGSQIYHAPKVGITQPGTRRAVYAQTDVVFMTIHQTDETDLDKIYADLIDDRINPLLPNLKPAYLSSWPTLP